MDDLANLGLVDDEDIVLDEAALTLALLDHEDAYLVFYEDLLSSIASRLGELGGDAQSAVRRAALMGQVSGRSSASAVTGRPTTIPTTQT